MSHLVMATEFLWVLYPLLILPSVDAAHSHKGPQGLSCVNDFVNNVSCSWHGSPVAPDLNCSISGMRRSRDRSQIQTCTLEQHINSPPGCSFAFENMEFNCFKPLPYIRMECGGRSVDNITNYSLCQHIKMHPPGIPQVNVTTNDTLISWSPGSPRSRFITSFQFNIQIKQGDQTWEEVNNMFTNELKLKRKTSELKGLCQVRVRVLPPNRANSTWSNWSPITSWVGATSQNDPEWPLDLTSLLKVGLIFILVLISVGIPVLYRKCVNKGRHIKEQVPNPSKYFHSLHSVHKGNLKTWLNHSTPGSFFTTQPCDHISPIKLCGSDSFEVVPSTSPSFCSASALLHPKGCQSAGSDISGVEDNSSSSSFFSNMGYFLSCSSSRSAQIDSNSANFPYLDDFHNNCNLTPSRFPPFTPIYESLKWEPQSPDSGFGITLEDEEERQENNVDEEVEGIFHDHPPPPILILPFHPPYPLCPNPSAPPAPTSPSPTQASSGSQTVDAAAAGGCYVAWPVAGAMSRSSSMPVESSRTGYLTLKELQTTFSNKSI